MYIYMHIIYVYYITMVTIYWKLSYSSMSGIGPGLQDVRLGRLRDDHGGRRIAAALLLSISCQVSQLNIYIQYSDHDYI